MISERKRQMESDIRTIWFKDHVASWPPYNGVMDFLIWSKAGTNIYSISYAYRNGYMFVYGDLGEAIYQWHPSIVGLIGIAGCELSYFASKCEASEYGRGYKKWEQEAAKEYMLDYFQQQANDSEKETFGEIKRSFEALGGWRSLVTQFDWWNWLESEGGYEFFGNDYMEYGDIGMEIDIRCRSHLIGLKMAVSQIEERKKESPKHA